MPPDEELPPYVFRDVGAVVDTVLGARTAKAGDAFLVLVREPSGAQLVEHVARVRRGRWAALDRMGRSALLETTVDRMPIPERVVGDGPRHSVLTIAVRRGMTVIGAPEIEWLIAWRYANCAAHTYKGDLVLLTEHGWCDFMTRSGGWEPRLAA